MSRKKGETEDALSQLNMFRFSNVNNEKSARDSESSNDQAPTGAQSEGTSQAAKLETGWSVDDQAKGTQRLDSYTTISSYGPKGSSGTKFYYVEESNPSPTDPEGVAVTSPPKYVCGIRQKFFYAIMIGIAIVVIAAAVIGAVLAIRNSKSNHSEDVILDAMDKFSSTRVYQYPVPTYTAYPLETGPWEIDEPIDVEEGICGNHPQAIDNCWNPYELKFNILQDSRGFKIQTDSGILNDKYLYPPKTPEGLYTFNVTDFEYPSYFEPPALEAKCNTSTDAYFMLGENYKFHLIFVYTIPRKCVKNTGYVAEAGQTCRCEWMGYVNDKFKGKEPTTTTVPTPTLRSTTQTPTTRRESSTSSGPMSPSTSMVIADEMKHLAIN